MRSRALAAALCLALAGCDFVSAVREPGGSAASDAGAGSAPAPGWESLDDDRSAVRLYYQFVDARGQVRFVERLDDVPEAWRERVGFVKMATPPPITPADASRARAAQVERSGGARVAARAQAQPARPAIVLYSATWCGACRKAKRHLDQQGIDYELRDVDNPHHAAELLRKTGQRAIPVLDVGGRILTGFNAQRYDALIGRA